MPDLTLYYLSASRAIRIAWLLETLFLPYKLVNHNREDTGLAPAAFKHMCGTFLGKAPVLTDGELVIQESGAITEYLCENYDPDHRLIPQRPAAQRAKVLEYIHAAEGAFMVHCLPIVYVRRLSQEAAEALTPGLAKNVGKDLDWLEDELRKSESGGRYLVGRELTAADIMVWFSIDFIFAMGLAPQGKQWKMVEQWLEGLKKEEGWKTAVEKTAVEKTGYSLKPR